MPKVLLSTIAVLTFCGTGYAQKESVKPGINDSFIAPKVTEYVERFEREGREVYDHRDRIIAEANVPAAATLADIGAGTGLFTRLFAKEVGSEGTVVAVDIAKEFVDHVVASSREDGLSNVRGQVCTQDSVRLPAESIDVAFICDTYHHFEYPYKTMRSIHRALKPGGRVVLVEFHRREGESSDWILGHLRAGQDVFVDEIRRSGFEVLSEANFMKTSYHMTFRKTNGLDEEGYTIDSLNDIKAGLENQSAVLIDVREPGEWAAGHLRASSLSSLSEMQEFELKGDFSKLKLPQDQIIYTFCRSGIRSLTAAKLLRERGYDARALKEGFTDLANAGFETE